MSWWQFLLFPFAIIYDLITRCRNWLYDIGVFKIHSFPDIKIISVGNLSVGGTGKTPMVEYLIRWALKKEIKTAVLSRGYGRKTKGVLVAKYGTTADRVGDESQGYFQQFGSQINVVVAEQRVEGIREIEGQFPETKLVILDDAFQHRSVRPDFSVLLTTYDRPFWRDFVLPSGRLRENRAGWKRADFILITKSKDQKLEVPDFSVPSGFTGVEYADVQMENGDLTTDVYAVSGLANNAPFIEYVNASFNMTGSATFKDHHTYSADDISGIIASANDATIICTQKDAVKLKDHREMADVNWGWIPIEVDFLSGEKELLQKLQDTIDV